MRLSLLILLSLLTLCPTEASARFRRRAKPVRVLVSGFGEGVFATTSADTVAGASYTKTYSPAFMLGGGAGILLYDNWYLGARFEYSLAGRSFSSGGTTQTDTLKYLGIGGEIGIASIENRLRLFILGGVGYPLQLQVESTAGTFTGTTRPLSYYGKIRGGVSFSTFHSFYLEAGFRIARLGQFADGGTAYLPGGAALDLSGPFAAFGIQFEF